jgi:hypothetical protein
MTREESWRMSVKRKKKASRERIQGVVVGKIELVWEIRCECGGGYQNKANERQPCCLQLSALNAASEHSTGLLIR